MGLASTFQHVLKASAVLFPLHNANHLNITLPGYGNFVGIIIDETLSAQPLPAAVNAWLGIDYAYQPVGKRRFAPPAGFPLEFYGTKDASTYGPVCIQGEDVTFVTVQDEACLSMNVYKTQGILTDQKLPVFVWIHGGGFVAGSARSFDGASFVANSKEPLIVVTFNYRLNSLGFLPSPVFERLGLLNLGLLDQELLFKFVQRYISQFGGDPARVTIGGRSAGGHSVGIHLFHNYDNIEGPSPLFSQAILQSGSVTGRSFPNAWYPLYQSQFAQYLFMVGCSDASNASDSIILSCLRSVNISLIRHASDALWAAASYTLTWPFQPTRGGPLLERAGSVSGQEGTFFKVPIMATNVPDESRLYTYGNLTTNSEFLKFFKTLIPSLNEDDLSDLETLYPDPTGDTTGTFSPYANSPNSTQYTRLSTALTDYMYTCPGQETAVRLSTAGVPVYKLRYNTNNSWPSWQGIPHTSDTKATWAEPTIQFPDVGNLLQGYFADFVTMGDPNAGKRGVPVWPNYVDGQNEGLPGLQLLMEPFGQTRVEGDAIRRMQCEWWRNEGRAARLEK